MKCVKYLYRIYHHAAPSSQQHCPYFVFSRVSSFCESVRTVVPSLPTFVRMNHTQTITESPSASISDNELGITEYINASQPLLKGDIKYRWTDFLVHEIAPNGTTIAELTTQSIQIPEFVTDNSPVPNHPSIATEQSSLSVLPPSSSTVVIPSTTSTTISSFSSSSSSSATPSSFEVSVQRLRKLINYDDNLYNQLSIMSGLTLPSTINSVVVDIPPVLSFPAPTDKEDRRSIHQLLRICFDNRLNSYTETNNARNKSSNDSKGKNLVTESKTNMIIVKPMQSTSSSSSSTPTSSSSSSSSKRSREKMESGSTPSVNDDGGWTVKWPLHLPNYVRFVLHKHNIDTFNAVRLLARVMHVKEKSFHYAGTKDKRGITSQFMTMYKVHPNKVLQATKKLKNIMVGNFSFVPEKVRLGQLYGNQFTLVLRHLSMQLPMNNENSSTVVSGTSTDGRVTSVLNARLQEWESNRYRFINYFGRQRFGTGSSDNSTYYMGKALLLQNYEEIINRFFVVRSTDNDNIITAKEYFQQGLWIKAKNHFPPYMVMEREILNILITTCERYERNDANTSSTSRTTTEKKFSFTPGAAYDAVMNGLTSKLRFFYISSYQSLLWNRMVSQRIRRYGKEPVEGDLVYASVYDQKYVSQTELNSSSIPVALSSPIDTEIDRMYVDEVDNTKEDSVSVSSNDSKENTFLLPNVQVLQTKDITSGLFSIEDVIVPVPGYAVQYPTHTVGMDIVCQLLFEDGVITINPSLLSIKEKEEIIQSIFNPRDQRLQKPGDYRRIVQDLQNFAYTVVPALSDNEDLSLTDWDKLHNKSLPNNLNSNSNSLPAVRLSFSLNRSAYATIAVREIIQQSLYQE